MSPRISIDPGAFGCEVRGVEIGSLSSNDVAILRDRLYRHRLLIIKDQALTEQGFCDFAHRLIQPIPYLQTNYHHPEFPLIFVSSNVRKDGRQMGVARTGGYWHSDTSFEAQPKIITMLMPVILPAQYPRATLFVDMAEVYAALPVTTKRRLAGRKFIHSGRWRYKVRAEDVGKDMHEIMSWIDGFAPPVEHPAVLTHPHTKEKVLYGSRGFTVGISGMAHEEARELISEIFDFAESDRFVRRIGWSKGDVIVWDNRFLMHCSDRAEGPEEPTMMYRITGTDGYPLDGAASAAEPRDAELVS